MAESLGPFLVINRRLMYGIYPGGAKKWLRGESCECCDTAVSTCSGDCKVSDSLYVSPEGIAGSGDCCLPNSFYVKVSGLIPPTCFPGFSNSFSGEGSPNVVACAEYRQFFIDNVDLGLGFYWYRSRRSPAVFVINNFNSPDCSGSPSSRYRITAVVVDVFIIPPNQSRNPSTDKWRVEVRVSDCAGVHDDLPGIGTIFVSKWDFEEVNTISGPDTRFVPPEFYPCDGTVEIDGWDETSSRIFSGFWLGGSAVLKACCKGNPTAPECDNGTIHTWYQAITCGTTDELLEIWAREDWVNFVGGADANTSVAYRDEWFNVNCFYFHKALSPKVEVPTDPQPPFEQWLHSDALTWPTCTFCEAAYLQARDCDGDELLPVVVAAGDVLTDGSAYALPGTCIYFDDADATSTIPEGAELVSGDDLSEPSESCETCEGSTPCPGHNDDCNTTFTATVVPADECASLDTAAIPAAPSGVGNWTGTAVESEQIDIIIVCSGKYWVAIVTFNTSGVELTFRKLRVDDCPTGVYEWMSTAGFFTGSECAGSTLTVG